MEKVAPAGVIAGEVVSVLRGLLPLDKCRPGQTLGHKMWTGAIPRVMIQYISS